MMKRGVIATFAVASLLSMFWAAPSFAQEEEDTGLDSPSARPAATSTPVQSLTEKDYFRTIKVVQKKPVSKARRVEISPFFAYLPNDDFVRGYIPGADIGFHFNEGLALEATVGYGLHSNKQLLGDIRKMGVQPAVLDRMGFMGSVGFNWSPLYGKIAYLERRIFAYDLFFATGFGVTNTELEITTSTTGGGGETVIKEKRDASFQGYYIGIGQRYYFTNFLAFRVELRNYAYTQRVDSNYNNRNNLLLSGGFSFLL